MKTYTVVGVYECNNQRWGVSVNAKNPREAEEKAKKETSFSDAVIVAAVIEGDVKIVA